MVGQAEVVNTWGSYEAREPPACGHDGRCHPGGDDEVWYIHTDGGVSRRDGMRTVKNISQNGLRVNQYYDTSRRNPDTSLLQDQGYQVTAGVEQTDTVWNFNQIMSGDYAPHIQQRPSRLRVLGLPGCGADPCGRTTPCCWADFPPGKMQWLPHRPDQKEQKAFFFPATRLYRYKEAEEGYWERELVRQV